MVGCSSPMRQKTKGHKHLKTTCWHNIVPSVGHSNATREQMLHSKATHVTHLYNAQRGLRHREPGVTGHAMLEDNMYCELPRRLPHRA